MLICLLNRWLGLRTLIPTGHKAYVVVFSNSYQSDYMRGIKVGYETESSTEAVGRPGLHPVFWLPTLRDRLFHEA